MDIEREINVIHFNADDGNRIVSAITMLGIPTFPRRYRDEENEIGHLVHWRLHLRWDGKDDLAAGSVVLDTQILEDDPDPDLVEIYVASRNSLYSSSRTVAPWMFTFYTASDNLKVQDFVDCLWDSALHKYRYNANCSGCLYWCMAVVQHFICENWLADPHEAWSSINNMVETVRQTEGYWVPDDQGTFTHA